MLFRHAWSFHTKKKKRVKQKLWFLTCTVGSIASRFGSPVVWGKERNKTAGNRAYCTGPWSHCRGKLQFIVSTQLTGFLKSRRIALFMLLRASLRSPGKTKLNIRKVSLLDEDEWKYTKKLLSTGQWWVDWYNGRLNVALLVEILGH